MVRPKPGWPFGAALCAWLGAVPFLGGCVDAAAFHCQSAEQCVSGAVQGACEPSGFCSFPDEACDSGRRYADHAATGYAKACVGTAPGETDGGAVDATGSDMAPQGSDGSGDCTGGTRNVVAPTGRCYMYFAGAKDWLAANGACLALEPGATLVAITDAAENGVVAALVEETEAWTGSTDQVLEGTWLWSSSGAPLGYQNWRAGEPNDAGGEDCMIIEGHNGGRWDDRACSTLMPYVCERN